MNPLMDSTEVATLLKCSERTVEDHARAGRLPAVKFGDGWMFPTDALLRAVNSMAEAEAAKRAAPVAHQATHVTLARKPVRPNLADLQRMM